MLSPGARCPGRSGRKSQKSVVSTDRRSWTRPISSRSWLARLHAEGHGPSGARPTGTPPTTELSWAEIASGEELVAATTKKDLLRALLSDALAVENEGYGFSRGVQRIAGNPEFMVIRGICDAADASKNDDFHAIAAASAAGFAFELLAQLPPVDEGPRATVTAVVPPDGETTSTTESPISGWFTRVLTDDDLIDDSHEAVCRIADELVARDLDLGAGLIEIVTALETATSPVLLRRLGWLARRLVTYADTREPSFLESDTVDDAVRAHPRGSALALLEPSTWASLPSLIKRRLATIAFGPVDACHELDRELAPLIARLAQADAFNDDEKDRLDIALRLDDYGTLGLKGIPLPLIAERIVEDIECGNFDRQNPAARYLYRTELEIGSDSLSPDQDLRIGAALIDAAEGPYPANGAVEAIHVQRLVDWTESRLAGGIYAAMTAPGRSHLRWRLTSSAKNLIAAITTRDSLDEVLGLTIALIASTLDQPQGADTSVLFEDLDEIEASLSPEDAPRLQSFRDQLDALLQA